MYDPQEPKEPLANFRSFLACILFVARIGTATVEVFLHKGFGSRYLGLQALLGLPLILLWGGFWEGFDQRPLVFYFQAYLVMLVVARTGVLLGRLRVQQVHSRYTGTPRIWFLLPWMSETRVKAVEPLLVFFGGAFMCSLSEPLGSYLMFAAMCLWVSLAEIEFRDQNRALDMHDAVIEQEILAERFRQLRGRR